MGGDPGQGAREIWEPPSEERALWKAKPFPLPREQEFFKGCNYRAAEREAAGGSHAAAPAGSQACAELPACPRPAPGTPRRPQGNPGPARVSWAALPLEITRLGTNEVDSGLLLSGISAKWPFSSPLSFLSSAKFLWPALEHPKDTETAGNSPQSKERKTHNSPPKAACLAWIVQPKEEV